MLEIVNNSRYRSGLYPGHDRENRHQLTVVLKAGWTFDDNKELCPLDITPAIIEYQHNYTEIMPYKEKSEILINNKIKRHKKKFNYSPKNQQFDNFFQAGDIISHKIVLPQVKPNLQLQLEQKNSNLIANCDTIKIDSEKNLLEMIWRVGIPWQINDQRQGIVYVTN